MQRQYRLLGQIGQGQFGRVFCAIERDTGEIVALKDLDKDRFPTRLFLREFSNSIALQHPNIVSCLGFEYAKTGRYLVMDYCEGGTLRDLMESESKLSLVQSLKLIADILLGLEYAHNRDIVHCDLKPENILLNVDKDGWIARISDFGIARLRQEVGGQATGRGYTGSPAYMAPERFYGQYAPTSDLYAVGIMLYELIVGERPFSGVIGELQSAHINRRLEIPKTVPFILRSAIITALQKLPQKRFSCASEMLKSIELAIDILQAQNSDPCCLLITPSEPSSHELEIIRQELLLEPITDLAVNGEQVYLAMGNLLKSRRYSNNELSDNPIEQWQVKFDAPVINLSVHPQETYVITKWQEKHSFYRLSALSQNTNDSPIDNLIPLFTQNSTNLVSAISSQENWLALADDKLQIFKLPEFRAVGRTINIALPSQLIPLDRDRGLAIFSPLPDASEETIFRLFYRRSQIFEAFSLPFSLTKVIASQYEPYRLFALEKSHAAMGVLINLRPLKITRIALEIFPDYILERKWGYILCDRTGQFRLLDRMGNRIGRFELPFPPTAIAAFDDFKLLVATWSASKGILYGIDFQKVVTFKEEE
ncbi:MAG: serine/threonine protein kinase [Hydrococcus sp. Prado102]|jgi:serine/threonine-protein kinase|nr:serine/threonine protein kinase [Hydrococcus sp. Prado102]